jgi:hypothetical protein
MDWRGLNGGYFRMGIMFFLPLSFNLINPKKDRNTLPIQRKAVLLQADYYHKRIRD